MNDISTPRGGLRPSLAEASRFPATERPALDIWLVFRRQKWPLILGAVAGLLVGLAHYATSPRAYYAAATVMVNEQTNDPTLEFMAGVPLMRNETAVLNQMQVMRSLDMAESVVRDLDLHNNPSFTSPPSSLARQTVGAAKARARALVDAVLSTSAQQPPAVEAQEEERILAAAMTLRRDLGIAQVGRSFSIELSLVHHDPALAAAVANAYAAAFLSDSQSANQEAAGRSLAWLRSHIDSVRIAANQAAEEAAAFEAENRVSDLQGLRQLESRAETLNDLHAALLNRYEMITIEGSYPASSGRLLSAATVPRDPALPKAWRLLMAGLVLGLMGGVTVAAWRELSETGLRTGEDVRKASGLAFLGYLPRFRKRRLGRIRPIVTKPPELVTDLPFISRRNDAAAAAEPNDPRTLDAPNHVVIGRRLPDGVAPSLFIPALVPDSAYAECLKNVLATISRGAPLSDQTIAVSSLNSREGSTTVAANLAQLTALDGYRTLLIDGDATGQGLSLALGVTGRPGLAQVATEGMPLAEAVVTLPVTGLELLPSIRPGGPATQPSAARMSRLLSEARAVYDVVVLDAQPLGLTSDVKSLMLSLDRVVLVADWGRTKRDALQQFAGNEPELSEKIAGVVLNRARMRRLGAYGVAFQAKSFTGSRAFS